MHHIARGGCRYKLAEVSMRNTRTNFFAALPEIIASIHRLHIAAQHLSPKTYVHEHHIIGRRQSDKSDLILYASTYGACPRDARDGRARGVTLS